MMTEFNCIPTILFSCEFHHGYRPLETFGHPEQIIDGCYVIIFRSLSDEDFHVDHEIIASYIIDHNKPVPTSVEGFYELVKDVPPFQIRQNQECHYENETDEAKVAFADFFSKFKEFYLIELDGIFEQAEKEKEMERNRSNGNRSNGF